jgi:hypothetical protein
VLAWTVGSSIALAALVTSGRVDAARWLLPGLIAAAFVPVPPRLRNLSGAFVLVGVPWLAFIAASAAPAIGRFVLYESGSDFWMFQRYAYRIVMQGHWLEGGSATFWFQPLYRWIVAALHAVFGDSSVGEWLWDGGCLLAGSLLAFKVAERCGGFRWGIAAAVLPLAVVAVGTPGYLIGRGLGEITSAGFLSVAALCAMRSRHGSIAAAVAAGVFATLAVYTRLNNLPMAIGIAAFAWAPRRWTPPVTIVATIAAGIFLFAWRTWYFTGVFSVFHGTQRELLAIWQPGTTLRDGLLRTIDSVMMVLTVNDPPRFDPFALPVLAGTVAAVLAAVRVPRLDRLPWPAILFFFSGLAGAFVARGSAYPGRFSVHVIPIACALAVCAVATTVRAAASRAPAR